MFTAACGDDNDDPDPIEEGEVITSMTIVLEPSSTIKGVDRAEATYSDPDGPGGNAPVVTTLNLKPNVIYNATVTFADNNGDITNEIEAEGTDHAVIFEPTPESLLSVQRTDMDANNFPIGLEATITTGEPTTGTNNNLRVTLMHQPGIKTATSGVSVGETDIQALFPVVIAQ